MPLEIADLAWRCVVTKSDASLTESETNISPQAELSLTKRTAIHDKQYLHIPHSLIDVFDLINTTREGSATIMTLQS